MRSQKINHLAVWLCVLACQVLSITWYSPLLFANTWMHYLGKTFADFNGENINGLLFSIAGSIAFCYFLSWLYIKLQVSNGKTGLLLAFIIATCCFAFTTFTQDSFSLRPIGLSLINTGNILLNFCVVGLVLGSWRKYRIN